MDSSRNVSRNVFENGNHIYQGNFYNKIYTRTTGFRPNAFMGLGQVGFANHILNRAMFQNMTTRQSHNGDEDGSVSNHGEAARLSKTDIESVNEAINPADQDSANGVRQERPRGAKNTIQKIRKQRKKIEKEDRSDTRAEPAAVSTSPPPQDASHPHATTQSWWAFCDTILGLKEVISNFQRYPQIVNNLRNRSYDPTEIVAFTFIFKGSTGTGKTYTARALGGLFHDIGLLGSNEVVECSVSDLTRSTSSSESKVADLLERAIGKVVIVDYSCHAGSIPTLSESAAVMELMNLMNSSRYHRKMVVVLTGYEYDMDKLMKANEGLCSRFDSEFRFPAMDEESCVRYLRRLLKQREIDLPLKAETDTYDYGRILKRFSYLKGTAGWANARSVEEVAREVTLQVYGDTEGRFVDEKTGGFRLKMFHLTELLDSYQRGGNGTWKESQKDLNDPWL